jgi:hypothetical protein
VVVEAQLEEWAAEAQLAAKAVVALKAQAVPRRSLTKADAGAPPRTLPEAPAAAEPRVMAPEAARAAEPLHSAQFGRCNSGNPCRPEELRARIAGRST